MTPIPVLGGELAGPWFRVRSILARRGPASAEHDFLDILPAAAAAARAGRPLVAGWLCRAAGAPLEFVTNAALPAPQAGNGCALLFPPGARGAPVTADWITACGALVWALCPGRQALPLLSEPAAAAGQETRQPGRFESALGVARSRPFGWLVVAEPTGLLDAEVAGLRTQVTVLRHHDEETLRFGTDRAIRRLAELDAFREAGLWLVRVLVGAGSAGDLARIGPVLAGSADLGQHPYRLGMCRDPQPLGEALAAKAWDSGSGVSGKAGDAGAEAQVPFLATAGLLTALAGLPQREVPGLRVLDAGQFDVTSETGTSGTAGLPRAVPAASLPGQATATGLPGTAPAVGLGVILDAQDRPAGEFLVPLPTFNRHALVTGATGAGKSQTVRHLLTGLTRAGLPWLVIEPVKSEYPGMAGRLAGLGPAGEVTVLNPADPGAIPLSVNPLAPERGYPVQAHIDMVRALFLAAFDADEPFPQIIAQALQRVYEANGWDVVTGGTLAGAAAEPAVPSLAQLQRAALEVIEDVGYGRELQADVRGFVDVRLRSLRIGSAGRFFEGGHPADIARLLRRNVVLCLEDVANDEDKAILVGNGYTPGARGAGSSDPSRAC